MNRILIFTFALIFISEGLGDWGMKVLKIRQKRVWSSSWFCNIIRYITVNILSSTII